MQHDDAPSGRVMGVWDELRSRLFGDGEDRSGPREYLNPPVPTGDLTPPAPRSNTESEDTAVTPSLSQGERESGADVARRQERAAARILDDEGLRSDLTDDEYQPLLDWALGITDQVAAGTADQDDERAEVTIDAGIGIVRDVMRAAADAILAHNEGRCDDRRWALDVISQTWRPSIVGGDESDLPSTLWQPLQQLADRLDAESNLLGSDVAGAIVGALAPSAPDPGDPAEAVADQQSGDPA